MKLLVTSQPLARTRKSGRLAIESVELGTVDMMVDSSHFYSLFRIGIDLTMFPPGTCKQCRRGFNQACVKEQINGITRDGGCTSSRFRGKIQAADLNDRCRILHPSI